mmetsp:Transcript_67555/g.148096  ORF Transcript_67555/g.148096 Transcript_67555/m.148096 type:complete len:223 (-) Transcript_67555:961-1629(-)
MTHLASPMNGAQQTFVRMQGIAPMMAPFQNASIESNFATGIAKATVHAKKILIIQEVTRLVCLTQTWWAWCGGARHAKDMPAMKQPHRWVPRKYVMVAYVRSKTIIRRKRTSSVCGTLAPSFTGTLGSSHPLMNFGQNAIAAYIAMSMRAMPTTGFTTTWTKSNSPPKENRMLNKTRDRMSSTKAAVIIACPKFSCRTPASPKRRKAIPTLVGANAVPAEIP